jgi:hypothetical protein
LKVTVLRVGVPQDIVGDTAAFTVTFKVVVVAQSPAVGVNV